MQVLHAYSLDPVAESTGDRKSFAFRKGRSQFDLHSYVVKAFEGDNPPMYAVKTDVKACYASISHEWLMTHIPMDRRVLKQLLKAGHVFCGGLFPAGDFGISLGSSLSPIIANMTLDGAQQAIFEGLHGKIRDIDFADGDLIRFSDDMLITARSMESAEKILQILTSFFAVRGLRLSEQKTEIVDITKGFNFLSHHYQINNGVVYASPSEKSVANMERNLCDLISSYCGGQKTLIEKINKKLVGWGNYHKITEATRAFRHIDNVTKTLLLNLCEKLNPNLTRAKIISKYFYQDIDGEYVYALENKPDVRVHRLVNTVLTKHQPVSLKAHPYIDKEYYEERSDNRAITKVTGKYTSIWTRQKGKCFYCGNPILLDESKTLVQTDLSPSHPDNIKNLAYVHGYCALGEAEFYDSDHDITSLFDLYNLLLKMQANTKRVKKYKFYLLNQYFRQRSEPVFTLKFEDIEKITELPLCKSAYKYLSFWFKRDDDKRISHCWLWNGYKIRKISLEKKLIVFERQEKKGDPLNIPAIFLSGRIPPDAKAELEIVFAYIQKKYGL